MMDAIQEIFPFALVEIVRRLIPVKLRNLTLNLKENKDQHYLLISMVYEELHGIEANQLHVKALAKKYVKSKLQIIQEKNTQNPSQPIKQ